MLVVDQAQEAVTHLCLHGNEYGGDGKGYFDVAAERYRRQPGLGILLIEPKSSPLVRAGILPSFAAMSRRELIARDVSEEDIFVICGQSADVWQESRRLGAWLQSRPQARVQFLCNRFRSRSIRTVLDATLDPAIAARVGLLTVTNPGCEENNWWQSRYGVREFIHQFLLLCYVIFHGENTEAGPC